MAEGFKSMRRLAAGLVLGLAAWAVLAGSGCGQADPDAEILARLRREGSDLSRPHVVEFYFYFRAEENARKAADQIRAPGFDIKIEPRAGEETCMLHVTRTMVPDLETFRELRKKYEAAAWSQGGVYDGWSARVVR